MRLVKKTHNGYMISPNRKTYNEAREFVKTHPDFEIWSEDKVNGYNTSIKVSDTVLYKNGLYLVVDDHFNDYYLTYDLTLNAWAKIPKNQAHYVSEKPRKEDSSC